MRNIRFGVMVLLILLCCSATPAPAQVSIGIGLPNLRIGINLPLYPELVPVPGYPVYYAPRLNANYFFYDGMYWVYLEDNWYTSYWFNGPWSLVEPAYVPLFILRIPVRYYRHPPSYFRGWRSDAPPRWGEHWGSTWEQHRIGWDSWSRASLPPRAPLPSYQRHYTGDRYPRVEQQRTLRSQHYRYQPRDRELHQQMQRQGEQRAPAATRQEEPRKRSPAQQEIRRTTPRQATPPQQERRQQPAAVPRERQAPKPQSQEQQLQKGKKIQAPRDQGQRREEDRGRERDR